MLDELRKRLILIIVAFAMLMEAIDITIINTAITNMAHSLNVTPIDLKLALISYLLSLAIFIPISGWIADKFGIKKVFIFALSLFTLSSFACGFTTTLEQLIIARFIQGLGGSFTMPVGRLIILRICERHELIIKMGMVVMVAALGMMLGPVLGGILTTHFSWPWVFWVNVPFGLLAILLAYFFFPSMPSRPVLPLDKLGFILFGGGLATLTYSLSALSESNLSHSSTLAMLLCSISLLCFYYWHSKKQAHPIVKLTLLSKRTFYISALGNLCARLSFGGIPFLLPLLFQIGLKFTPQLSGLLLAPISIGVLLIKPLSTSILRLLGYKKLLCVNTVLVAAILCSFMLINTATSLYTIGFLTFGYGFLIALQYTAMNSLAYANINEEELSSATSIMSTIQQLSQSFGIAFAAILVTLFSPQFSIHSAAIIRPLHESFLVMAVVTLFSVMVFGKLKPEDGQELLMVKTQVNE
ncbi:MFS transporter [Legionella sp. km772]|uniref:MFS transporter n=1 Tax=Legionella sp. km772 TaxID=2498111 RepID=UPI000F8C90A5|nr:MFS transporter [Legionella sp. km772]RUR12622.1 MFS transporter [Legionella sp. km772]